MQELDSRFSENLTDFAFLEPKNMFTLDSEKRILDLAKRYPNLDNDRLLSQYKLNRNCVKNTQTILEVKNKLRTTMTQERLESLILVSIEKEILEKLQIQDFVDKFAEKDRRMKL
ncbi:hypothetical protein QTP88_017772 [Uroleucon formosanum]